jgi:hypothetical protein
MNADFGTVNNVLACPVICPQFECKGNNFAIVEGGNFAKERVGFSKLVVAYSRPLNLQNRFSVRDIHGRGKLVSEYLAE